MTEQPRVTKVSPLPSSEAKWVEFQKIEWKDQTGASRVWEAANRKTRGSSGIDAVAIAPILLHPSRPPSTLVITQFRPPAHAVCVEFPAGLIDEGETPEQAAVRELREETGYEGKLISITPTMMSDPGLTTANMQFAVVEVQLQEGDKEPEQHLDDGEHIQRHVIPLKDLYSTLLKFSEQENTTLDARLFHWACGVQFARDNASKYYG
jgi:ADP-ribose pyrophosphatase